MYTEEIKVSNYVYPYVVERALPRKAPVCPDPDLSYTLAPSNPRPPKIETELISTVYVDVEYNDDYTVFIVIYLQNHDNDKLIQLASETFTRPTDITKRVEEMINIHLRQMNIL